MWREFFTSYALPCFFGEPAPLEAVQKVELALKVAFPSELREIFSETDGVSVRPVYFEDDEDDKATLQILWTLNEITERNSEFREWDAYPNSPFDRFADLLFFASEPNGDPVGFMVTDGNVVKPEIMVMCHEDYGARREQCSSLHEYLTILMESCQ